jgi:hypothetical protein
MKARRGTAHCMFISQFHLMSSNLSCDPKPLSLMLSRLPLPLPLLLLRRRLTLSLS